MENFRSIRFKPEHFHEYLLKDVGFKSCELLGTPLHNQKGNIVFSFFLRKFSRIFSFHRFPKANLFIYEKKFNVKNEFFLEFLFIITINI